MSAWPAILAGGTLLLTAAGLTRLPRPLFVEAAEGRRPSLRLEAALAGGLAAVGAAAFASTLGGPLGGRLALALALSCLAAVIYADARFFIIPDLYSALLAVLALAASWALPLPQALAGAALCGGLLGLVAWAFKRTRGVDGLGYGDVKLAAALGGLLGAETGVWMIAVSAGGGAVLAILLQRLAKPSEGEGPLMIPYGVALALAGGALLVWRLA